MVDLGPGYLDPELVPTGPVRRWTAQAVDEWGSQALGYGANAGPWPLRAHLAARLARTGGHPFGPGNVLTTGGTSAALNQIAVRLAREGRAVLTEALTYDLGRMIFAGCGVQTVAVPGPVDDIDIDELARAARRAVRATGKAPALYLIPTFHNPTGRVLSAARRHEVLGLVEQMGSIVIEDQAYADLGYEPEPSPAAMCCDAADPDRVITLYSFAKCLAPGIRLGWLVGSERLVDELSAEPARLSGGGPNHFSAMVITAACLGGDLDRHVVALREQLRLRRDTLLAALAEGLPEGFRLNRPAGGFFVWVGLPDGVSDEELLRAAEDRGLSFAAGHRFGTAARGVRLCFAACGPEELTRGAALFLAACQVAVPSGGW